MSLEELPRDTPEAKRRHALGLLGAGELSGGIPELRELMAAEPGAGWIPDARLAIARSLVAAGRYREAFDEFEAIVKEHGDHPVAPMAAEGRYTAARLLCREDMTAGALLYDRIITGDEDRSDQLRALQEKADAYFAAGRFLDAKLEYLSLYTDYGPNERQAYAHYMAAQCEWRTAEWLDLGLEQVQAAEASLRGFARSRPDDVHAAEARQLADEAKQRRAEINWQIALYYRDVEQKPWASINYLKYVADRFPGTNAAGWAQVELDKADAALEAPLRGTIRSMELPGVSKFSGEE
jgi:outer membrane protein assembly factor BamD (BamD/ComL family)